MTEPIKPATDEWIATTKERLGLLRGTSLDLVAGDSISRLIARIQSDEARIKALELERDTVQQYADRTGANLRAAEGTLAERDEQIERYEDLLIEIKLALSNTKTFYLPLAEAVADINARRKEALLG